MDGDVEKIMNEKKIIIKKGYGMCVEKEKYKIDEMVEKMKKKGKKVRFGINKVDGRMNGKMNVMMEEEGVKYDEVLEMDEINKELNEKELVIVIGDKEKVKSDDEDEKK